MDGAVVASCAAPELGGGAPLGLWAELIGDLSRDLDAPPLDAAWPAVLAPLVPDLEHRLGRPPGRRVGTAPALERARLFEAVVALLEWAGRRPLVLLFEDVHAADAASLELIGYVARRLAGRPVLLVLTRRPFPRRPEADAVEHALRTRGRLVGQVTLRPLPAAEVARLVRLVAPLASERVDQVVAAADGNALLAVEWARALRHGQDQPPESLRGAVRAALARLDEDALLVAHFAAVAARELDRRELAALPVRSPSEAASRALDSGLLTAPAAASGTGTRCFETPSTATWQSRTAPACTRHWAWPCRRESPVWPRRRPGIFGWRDGTISRSGSWSAPPRTLVPSAPCRRRPPR
jgi:hypothetical protein